MPFIFKLDICTFFHFHFVPRICFWC
jgi:hypothetical protein